MRLQQLPFWCFCKIGTLNLNSSSSHCSFPLPYRTLRSLDVVDPSGTEYCQCWAQERASWCQWCCSAAHDAGPVAVGMCWKRCCWGSWSWLFGTGLALARAGQLMLMMLDWWCWAGYWPKALAGLDRVQLMLMMSPERLWRDVCLVVWNVAVWGEFVWSHDAGLADDLGVSAGMTEPCLRPWILCVAWLRRAQAMERRVCKTWHSPSCGFHGGLPNHSSKINTLPLIEQDRRLESFQKWSEACSQLVSMRRPEAPEHADTLSLELWPGEGPGYTWLRPRGQKKTELRKKPDRVSRQGTWELLEIWTASYASATWQETQNGGLHFEETIYCRTTLSPKLAAETRESHAKQRPVQVWTKARIMLQRSSIHQCVSWTLKLWLQGSFQAELH